MESTISISTSGGAGKTKNSSKNPAGQELAFPSCINLYWSIAIGAPVRIHLLKILPWPSSIG